MVTFAETHEGLSLRVPESHPRKGGKQHDDPLNLNISISGGKENNDDFPSSGE